MKDAAWESEKYRRRVYYHESSMQVIKQGTCINAKTRTFKSLRTQGCTQARKYTQCRNTISAPLALRLIGWAWF
jgi:hypothetical protein